MPSFLILKRTGPEPTDLDVVGLVDSKKIEEAVSDFAPEDVGQYTAVSYERDEIDKQEVQKQVVLKPITKADEEAAEAEAIELAPASGGIGVSPAPIERVDEPPILTEEPTGEPKADPEG